MGFTDLLSRLPSGKALPPSHYDEEIFVASIEKFLVILTNASNFIPVNRVIVDRLSVAVNSIVNFNLSLVWLIQATWLLEL